jgi:type II secretory pathway predicted ATPase ExeA
MNLALYLAFFGFTSAPFGKEVSDADLWLPPSKQDVVDGLCEAADEHECALLLGEPGWGKTCVLRAVRQRLPPTHYRLTYCHNATLGKRDFYRQLCVALGLTPSATAAAVFYAVSSHVQELGKERLHPVFLLDEAHLLHADTLDHLHILLNVRREALPRPGIARGPPHLGRAG